MLSAQLREAAIWRTVAEVTRHAPGRLTVLETHGGAFVTIKVRGTESTGGSIRLRRSTGEAHLSPLYGPFSPEVTWDGYLDQVAQADDPHDPISNFCERVGITTGHHLPAGTPDVIVYRVIAAFYAHACFGRPQSRCYNGQWDTSDGGHLRLDYFTAISPGACEAVTEHRPGDLLGRPGYRFWFLLQDDDPRACLQDDGQMWGDDGDWEDLAGLYRAHQRVWPVVDAALGRLLP